MLQAQSASRISGNARGCCVEDNTGASLDVYRTGLTDSTHISNQNAVTLAELQGLRLGYLVIHR